MEIKRISAAEVHARSVGALGLDSDTLDLLSTEAIAEALRRAARFRCPCTGPTLVATVVEPLRALISDTDATKALIEEVLEAVVAHGDIVEEPEVEETSGTSKVALLYSAPPSFVIRKSGTAILIGGVSSELSALSDLECRVEFKGHVRHLSGLQGEKIRQELRELGLIELPHEYWLKSPAPVVARKQIKRLDSLLNAAAPSHDIPGILLLDSERPVRYYRGRWVEPKSQSGRFVARRNQKYGAQLWCYAELHNGKPTKFIDLPLPKSRWRGCDEAWYLQMAIDAERGTPQKFTVVPGYGENHIVQFYSPVPMWARRRWDAVGESVQMSGCLFAYQFNANELHEEARFAREALWLEEVTTAFGQKE
jgi:hypothetical protein